MKSINRRLPVSLFIVVVVAVALVALGRPPTPQEVARDTVEAELPLLAFPEEAVLELVIQRNEGERVVLRRYEIRDDGTVNWRLVEPMSASANDEIVTNAVLDLSAFHAFRSIELDDETMDVSTFGLDPPLATMEIRLGSTGSSAGEELAKLIFIGETTPVVVGEHATYYVQLPGDGHVYAAGGPALSLIKLPFESLIDDDVQLLDDAGVNIEVKPHAVHIDDEGTTSPGDEFPDLLDNNL